MNQKSNPLSDLCLLVGMALIVAGIALAGHGPLAISLAGGELVGLAFLLTWAKHKKEA